MEGHPSVVGKGPLTRVHDAGLGVRFGGTVVWALQGQAKRTLRSLMDARGGTGDPSVVSDRCSTSFELR